MTEETGSTGGEAFTVTELPADAPESFNSASEAAAYFTSLKAPKPEKEQPAERAEVATAENELSVEDNAAPLEEATGETQEVDPAAEPPLPLPRSWAKEQEDHWKALPRATQEFVIAQASKDSEAVRRSQNETAAERAAAKAEREQTEKVRQQFEAKTKAALEVLEREQLRDFPDIKTMADVAKMALEDPFRKIQWDVHQDQIRTTAWEAQQVEQRKTQEHQAKWREFRQAEDVRASEIIPELADKAKSPEFMTKAAKLLRDVNFSQNELNAIDGGEKISPFDHRMQSIIADAVRYRDIMAAKTAVAAKPLPPVQRPGTSRPSGQGSSERLQALDSKLNNSGDLKDAAALLIARRGQRRAS